MSEERKYLKVEIVSTAPGLGAGEPEKPTILDVKPLPADATWADLRKSLEAPNPMLVETPWKDTGEVGSQPFTRIESRPTVEAATKLMAEVTRLQIERVAIVDKGLKLQAERNDLWTAIASAGSSRCPHCDADFLAGTSILTSNPPLCGNCRKVLAQPCAHHDRQEQAKRFREVQRVGKMLAKAAAHAERFTTTVFGENTRDGFVVQAESYEKLESELAAALAEARKLGLIE